MAKDTKKFVDRINEGAGLKRPKLVDEAISFGQKFATDYKVTGNAQQMKPPGQPKGWYAELEVLSGKPTTKRGARRSSNVWARVEGNRINFRETADKNFVKSVLTNKASTFKELPKSERPKLPTKETVKNADGKAFNAGKKMGTAVRKTGSKAKKVASVPGKLFMKLGPKGKAIAATAGAGAGIVGLLKVRKRNMKIQKDRNARKARGEKVKKSIYFE